MPKRTMTLSPPALIYSPHFTAALRFAQIKANKQNVKNPRVDPSKLARCWRCPEPLVGDAFHLPCSGLAFATQKILGAFRFCMCTAKGGCSQSVAEDGPSLCDSCCWEQPTPGRSGCASGGLMGVILQVALPSRVLAAARLQCGAAGAGASRGLGVCAEHARLAARGESARAMEIGDFLVWLGPVANSQCVGKLFEVV